MARILLVRHGEAEGNSEHRFIGQSQTPLTARGRGQAVALAQRMAAVPMAAIYASDLPRVADTVAPLAATAGVTVEYDRRWREIASGEWTGLSPAEIAAGWPDLWRRYAAGVDVERPGGESWSDVRKRTIAAVEDIAAGHGAADIVVVATHAGPIAGLLMWAAGLPPGAVFAGPFRGVGNASMTTIDVTPQRAAVILAVNDTGHLH